MEMVNIGIVGLGFMGMTHYRAIRRVRNARVAAICTRNPKKLQGDWRDIRGNFGDPGGIEDLTGIRTYTEIGDLLADAGIDLVDICLPTARHRDVAVAALRAGKDVLVEKPIALELEAANEMVAVAEETGRKLMVGQVLRFFPEFAYVKQVYDRGEFGTFLGGHFKRIITRPDWSADIADQSQTGGMAIDLHIHDSDFVNHLLGMPDVVCSSGVVNPGGYVDYIATQYLYTDRNISVTCCSGGLAMPGRPFEHGFDVYFEKGTLIYNSATCPQVTLLDAEGGVQTVTFEAQDVYDAFVGEIQDAVDYVSGAQSVSGLSGESARNSLKLCLLEIESVKRKAPVSVS
jgi:predicted dehydrogenase